MIKRLSNFFLGGEFRGMLEGVGEFGGEREEIWSDFGGGFEVNFGERP